MADDSSAPDVSFTVARHGYERTQVRAYIGELTERAQRAESMGAEARQQVAELEGELEIARREIGALSERLDAIGKPDPESTESSARLLEVAKTQATEITTRAQAAADDSWAAAEKMSTELREKYRTMLAELDSQHEEIHATHQSILDAARTQAEELTTVAERRRRELDTAAERDRVRIDREFSESMNAKRASLEREITQRREECVSEVDNALSKAREDAQRRVAAVNEQIKRLTEVRSELSERLRGTQELLARSVDLLQPASGEAELAEESPFPMRRAARTRAGRPAGERAGRIRRVERAGRAAAASGRPADSGLDAAGGQAGIEAGAEADTEAADEATDEADGEAGHDAAREAEPRSRPCRPPTPSYRTRSCRTHPSNCPPSRSTTGPSRRRSRPERHPRSRRPSRATKPADPADAKSGGGKPAGKDWKSGQQASGNGRRVHPAGAPLAGRQALRPARARPSARRRASQAMPYTRSTGMRTTRRRSSTMAARNSSQSGCSPLIDR